MAHTTPRLGLQAPDGTDPVTAYPAVMTQATGILDASTLYSEGPVAGRPAAGTAGRIYRATDVGGTAGLVFFDNGTAWLLVGQPVATVTSLPTTPSDGQTIDLLADATNGIVWRFRYRAASASTYKWEFVGGPALFSQNVSATYHPPNGSYAAVFSGSAPAITLPTLPSGGDFDVSWGSVDFNWTGGSGGFVRFALSIAGSAVYQGVDEVAFPQAAGIASGAGAARRHTAVASGTVLSVQSAADSSGVVSNMSYGWMSVVPVRVG